MEIEGGCHCGNLAFTLEWTPEPQRIAARACGCTFCTRHGGVWTSHAGGVLRVRVTSPAEVNHYAFGTRTAEFHVCRVCGVVPLVTSLIEGRLYAVVNVNTFTNVPAALITRQAASFEGEDEAARLARRARNWIGDVAFV